MAVERAGVSLAAENYADYISKLQSINKLQREVFNPDITKAYNDAIKKINDNFKNLPKNVPTPKIPPPDDAKKLQAALELLGQTGKYNISKVSEEALRLKEALDTVKKSGQFDIKPNIVKSDKLGQLTANLDKQLESPFKGWVGDVSQLTGAVGGLLAKFTLVAGALKIVNDLVAFGQAALSVAQRNETLAVSLQTVGEHSGYTGEQIKLAVQLLNKQGITTQAAQQSLLRMARANLSWAEASKLAAIAQGSAVVAGMNSSDAFERLVTGIQKMEPELLDELGITLRRSDAYEKFAATVGKNSKQLSDAEKQQAILNEIYVQSEAVLGVYDAAMETSGKKQASLARLVEETQNNVGKLLLPLQEVSVEMQTNFWKGAQQVSKGLQSWAPLLSSVIPNGLGKLPGLIKDWVAAMMGLEEGSSFIDKLGEGIYNFGRMFTVTLTYTRTIGETVINEMIAGWGRFFEMIKTAAAGDFDKAVEIFKTSGQELSDFPKKVGENFQTNLIKVLDEYPDLMKSWDEVNAGVEGSSEDLRLATDGLTNSIEDQEAATEKLIDSLEATKDAYKKAKDIQDNFEKSQTDAKADYEKGLAEAEKKYLQEREQKIKEFNQKLAEFDADNARKRKKMIDDFGIEQQNRLKEFNLQRAQAEQNYDLKVKQDKRKFYEDQKKALRDFQLSQLQAQRQQQVTDRRLRADGDVLALMEAREDFALQQQENKENFNNQQTTAKEAYEEQKKVASENFALQEQQARDSFALQTQMQREEFARRLAEFDENIAIQREKMIAAHQQELADLDAKYEEEKAKLAEQYQEKLAAAQEQRDEQLKQLGDSLKEEGKVTEEGMKEIADKISEVFGDQQAGDQLIKGWSDRSKNEINNVVDEINAKINELKENMKNTSSSLDSSSSAGSDFKNPTNLRNVPGNPSAPGWTGNYNSGNKPIGARHGFNGVVTGPQTFQVEPGVREHVQMTPVNKFGGSVKLSGSANVNVTGMGQGAAADIENQVATTIVQELRFAIKKLSRRGS